MTEHKKHICLGLLAHVDAGKTTLAESMLYLTGSIRKQGRVDHQDAFLDTFEIEKSRGITVFSKQAEFSLGDYDISLLDTPGHMDFSAEMERTLQVLDYAVLLISGADGVQGHVLTLWKLLARYQIPVFIFINKMDQAGTDRDALLAEVKAKLDDNCIDFSCGNLSDHAEELAMCDEAVMEYYLENEKIRMEDIAFMIASRKVFPCYFGSALKGYGVEALLDGIAAYAMPGEYSGDFGAKVYKISRDAQGTRLTHMKITGGCLKVKMPLEGEKADQIRVYSGAGYQTVDEACSGMVCAVTGLSETYAGQGIGSESEAEVPLLVPVLNYRLSLCDEGDLHQLLIQMQQLEEEEPQLHVVWNEKTGEIYVQLMGEVQIDIFKKMIADRFGVNVTFDEGHIVYKETIASVVEGVGHFEPLRHYAEVHLRMEPGEPGSGLVFESECAVDDLDLNWQRLILTHLEEKLHVGVLTGSGITDMKITLAAGRAHLKHTEGGDFRQATYRAVRQGLMQAQNVLLEPVYRFRLEIPQTSLGRAMSDIQQMHGRFHSPLIEGDTAVLEGTAPVVTIRGYQTEVLAYTRGSGQLTCEFKGYEPCHNTEEVVARMAYDPEADLENTPDSVFCAHGAGFIVNWREVPQYMHLESCLADAEKSRSATENDGDMSHKDDGGGTQSGGYSSAMDKELEAIFNRTFNQNKKETKKWNVHKDAFGAGKVSKPASAKPEPAKKQYLLVDGYNIIFAWDELKALSEISLDSARTKLMDILCNYQGFRKMTLILVFDAYKVEGGQGSVYKYKNIHVVYTKEAETADQYIEKTVHEMSKKYDVTVATSDGLEQVIIMGQGGRRLSASELLEDVRLTETEIRKNHLSKTENMRNYLLNHAPGEIQDMVGQIRGKKNV